MSTSEFLGVLSVLAHFVCRLAGVLATCQIILKTPILRTDDPSSQHRGITCFQQAFEGFQSTHMDNYARLATENIEKARKDLEELGEDVERQQKPTSALPDGKIVLPSSDWFKHTFADNRSDILNGLISKGFDTLK